MDSSPHIAYQAYKSKRHSRNISNPVFKPSASPPPQAKPTSSEAALITSAGANGIERASPDSARVEERSGSDAPTETIAAPTPRPRPVSMINIVPPRQSSPDTTNTDQTTSSSLPQTPVASTSVLTVDTHNGAAPPTPDGGSTIKPDTTPRRSSTFRYVPLRPPSTAAPRKSSPLRPDHSHTRSLSSATPSIRQFDHHPRPAELRSSSLSFGANRMPSSPLVQSDTSPSSQPDNATKPLPSPTRADFPVVNTAPPDVMLIPPSRTSSLMKPPPTPPKSTSPSPGSSVPSTPTISAPAMTPSSSTSSSANRGTASSASTYKAVYRAGFQPKGVYRPRTDEFLECRQHAREVGRVERERLERRFEKLINLHFSQDALSRTTGEKGKGKESAPAPPNRRASSFFDFDLSELRTKGAADFLKSAIETRMAAGIGGKGDIRAAEQKITPWQDDASASQCPLCSAPFHPLTNRKHHCRLCGQLICSLPPKQPQRPVPCSLLFVSDTKTGRIEEVKEGVDYGVRPRVNSTGKGVKSKADNTAVDEKFLKGVRICRECKPVMLQQQYRHEAKRIPPFARLYEALTLLEAEIEDALPQFQELMLSLSNHPDEAPPKEATAARKRLLQSFGEYDALSKRIRKLPCPGGSGSAQDRVQAAILTRANLFLQKNMFPLQSLPKPKKRLPPGETGGAGGKNGPEIDPDSELAHALQPLLEQEALLESFIDEAKAHRKFEDAKTLKANLGEIRAEIDRIMANAEMANSS